MDKIGQTLINLKSNNLNPCDNQPIIVYSDIYKQNIKTHLDYIFHESIYVNKPWEFEIIRDISLLIENGTDFVDVGANIGLITLGIKEMLRNSFPNKNILKYHCFECNPKTFQCLEYNTSFYENMYNYNFALSNQFGICEMSVNLCNWGGNFISNLNNQEQIVNPYNVNHIMVPKTKIAMIPLDSLLSVFKNKVGCIKMDVEGFEKYVLEGAQQLIIRDKPMIVIEVWPEQKEWIDNFLSSLNYEITHIYKDEKDNDFNYIYQYKSSFETSIL